MRNHPTAGFPAAAGGLTLDTEEPHRALRLLALLQPEIGDHPALLSEWHALNGLALYRTQQLSAAIAELKTAFRLKQAAPDSPSPACSVPAC